MDLVLVYHIEQLTNKEKILKILRDNHFDIIRKTRYTVHLFSQNEEWVTDLKLIAKELKRISYKKEDCLQFTLYRNQQSLIGRLYKKTWQ